MLDRSISTTTHIARSASVPVELPGSGRGDADTRPVRELLETVLRHKIEAKPDSKGGKDGRSGKDGKDGKGGAKAAPSISPDTHPVYFSYTQNRT